jgi:hypothetical protein
MAISAAHRDATYGEGLTMKDAIGCLRVSTREQGRSGLGLAAQRSEMGHDRDQRAAKNLTDLSRVRSL